MINLIPLSKSISKEEILKQVKYDSHDIVFVSGSLIDGTGNEKSDLDIFVVAEDLEKLNSDKSIVYNQNETKVSFAHVNGIGCDIEYWSKKNLAELISQINSINFDDSTIRTRNLLALKGIEFEQLTSFLHRFIVSEPIYNESEYIHYKGMLDKDKYFKLMARSYINSIDNFFDDIIGNLNKGEIETSLIITRYTLILSIMVYLYSHRISLDREKWAYALLKNFSRQDKQTEKILNEFNNLYFYGVSHNNQSFEEKIESSLGFINNLINISERNLGGL